MYIETDFGINFSSFKDLLRYMEEEDINKAKIIVDWWGAKFSDVVTIGDLREILDISKLLD